jgi:hypothetical protein
MSYEDIKEARVKRTTKDTMKYIGKRSRKHRNTRLEADEPEAEAEPEVAHTAKELSGKRKRGQKRKRAV